VAPDVAPPAGYTVRRPTPADLAAVAAFLAVVTAAEFGAPDFPEEELRGHWAALDLEADAWLVLAPDGGVAGYAALHHQDHAVLQAEGYVHPAHAGRGLGTFLVRATEARANEHVPHAPPGLQVLLYNAVNARNPAARHLLERAGYAAVRHFRRMVADLEAPPPPPAWPDGITVRTWASEADDHPAHLALEEAFRDHWGHVPTDFETWRRKGVRFDPGLWFLAFDGAEIAGALVGLRHLDMGWVSQLGVRRPWRKRGLGLALLRQAVAEFYRRGWTRVGLDVDAESETGATRLYERAGMRVDPGHAYVLYRKELRPGTEYIPPDADA
jgi:mycothiol synthase